MRLPLAFPRPTIEDDEAKGEKSPHEGWSGIAEPRVVQPLRILIVEDSVTAAQSLAAMLQLWKHQVVVCHDGFTGQEKLARISPTSCWPISACRR